jgi:hypothetical protein
MKKREQLIASALNNDFSEGSIKALDATVRLILGDMGQQYYKFWKAEGPGVLCFQPDNKDRSVFFMTLKELDRAMESCERENNGDLAETFRRILQAAQKIDPEEKAGYLINDKDGIRYLEIDYNKTVDA